MSQWTRILKDTTGEAAVMWTLKEEKKDDPPFQNAYNSQDAINERNIQSNDLNPQLEA